MTRILSALIGYVFGNFLFGFLYGKIHNKDIRKMGSGNVGTTNTVRTMGVLPGLITLICDMCKVILAYFVSGIIFSHITDFSQSYINILQVYAAFGAVIGHDFPFVLKFKGGKGIASSLGFLLVVLPESVPLVVLLFIIIVSITRYVSLGSILSAVLIAIEAIVLYFLGMYHVKDVYSIEVLLITVFLVCLTIFLHRSNIKRLLNHNENKFTFHPNV